MWFLNISEAKTTIHTSDYVTSKKVHEYKQEIGMERQSKMILTGVGVGWGTKSKTLYLVIYLKLYSQILSNN